MNLLKILKEESKKTGDRPVICLSLDSETNKRLEKATKLTGLSRSKLIRCFVKFGYQNLNPREVHKEKEGNLSETFSVTLDDSTLNTIETNAKHCFKCSRLVLLRALIRSNLDILEKELEEEKDKKGNS